MNSGDLRATLVEPYRSRAVPPGSARYWSWLFAATGCREPLLGLYALGAEWRALSDPGSEPAAAQAKLVWWRDEIRRLAGGSPLHPITRHIAALPNAASADLAALELAVEAVAAEVAGVPVERAAELDAHAAALYGMPLLVAARLGEPRCDLGRLQQCTTALATAAYLLRAVSDHRREARRGRIAFPVDELLAAAIDNEDLAADVSPPHLVAYLDGLRRKASDYFASAAAALAPGDRPALRHLAVLARLGARQLVVQRDPSSTDFHFADLYNAWSAARRAVAGR